MSKNQLPEGVGKKIVEALKKQSEATVNPVMDDIESIPEAGSANLEYYESIISDEITENVAEEQASDDQSFLQESTVREPEVPKFDFGYETPIQPSNSEQLKINTTSYQTIEDNIMQTPTMPQQKSFDIPANVAVLRRLISQLPSGVTKQTGAQIIRQTIEALGISMNNVLQEAQQVQENLNDSVKDCMSKVQEYKTNIMQLERHAQDYQRQMAQINDLISLFILTDKTK